MEQILLRHKRSRRASDRCNTDRRGPTCLTLANLLPTRVNVQAEALPKSRKGWKSYGVMWQVKPKLVGYSRHMRLHITVDEELVAELDRRAGSRRRSAFIAELIRRGLDDERRWDDIEAALGAIPDEGHEWDDDPGEWVRHQRSDRRRVG
jgi:Arc/MetJ family transcription regulator